MKNKSRAIMPTEAQIQQALFEWAEIAAARYPELRLLYHCPCGGSRHILEAVNLKKQGVKSGVPDLCLPCARGGYFGLYLELKSAKGKLSENQKEWLFALQEQGYKTAVTYSFDETRAAIENYLKL